MLRQDVFFAERNSSENYCIKRLQKATEMNNYSSKRKRTDEQCSGPEASSIIYERPGMGFLTMPFTSGTHTEVEHPRKRFHPSTDQAVLQNTGTNHPLDRVALSGAYQVLSNEQIPQFINSTVFARHETISKPGSDINVGYWSRGQSESRPNQQNFQVSGAQQINGMGRFATQSIGTLQTQAFTFEQEIASLDCIAPRKQTQQCARTENEKSTDKPRKKRKSKASEILPSSRTASCVDKVYSNGLTSTHHVTAGDHFQNSPTNKPVAWSLVPQPVLMHVKPMEAQTNQTISKMLALREAEMFGGIGHFENNGAQQVVAKRKVVTAQSDCTGRKRKKVKGQNEVQSTEQAGGKKTVKRIVVPPKIRQNPISYPPYVNRIMKILARGQQNQTESFDDIQDNNEKHTQKRSDELRTESVPEEVKQEVTTPRNVGVKKFFEDLSCDAILNTDKFYGPDPELFVTSGDRCSGACAPFL